MIERVLVLYAPWVRHRLRLSSSYEGTKQGTLITSRKQSWGQGYIFRSMCLEFCPQGRLSQGCLLPAVSGSRGVPFPGGLPALGEVPGLGVMPGGDPPQTATAVGSMHPTGMHSCLTHIF